MRRARMSSTAHQRRHLLLLLKVQQLLFSNFLMLGVDALVELLLLRCREGMRLVQRGSCFKAL
jgi:hypothetical protein